MLRTLNGKFSLSFPFLLSVNEPLISRLKCMSTYHKTVVRDCLQDNNSVHNVTTLINTKLLMQNYFVVTNMCCVHSRRKIVVLVILKSVSDDTKVVAEH